MHNTPATAAAPKSCVASAGHAAVSFGNFSKCPPVKHQISSGLVKHQAPWFEALHLNHALLKS
jgi:hypothetical protein